MCAVQKLYQLHDGDKKQTIRTYLYCVVQLSVVGASLTVGEGVSIFALNRLIYTEARPRERSDPVLFSVLGKDASSCRGVYIITLLFLSVCLPVCLSVCLSVCLPACLSVSRLSDAGCFLASTSFWVFHPTVDAY